MPIAAIRYLVAGVCVMAFVVAQTYQHLAYKFLIPTPKTPDDELRNYLLPVERFRALQVGGTILLLLVPYTVIALHGLDAAPVVSVLGLIFGAGFVGLEVTHRSIDFFVVGGKWAGRLAHASESERELLLRNFALWSEVTRGWYFPLLLSHLLASCCFLAATWPGPGEHAWLSLAPVAFALNALRLAGRIAGMFAGVTWLGALNGRLYYPFVLVINWLLMGWFAYLAMSAL